MANDRHSLGEILTVARVIMGANVSPDEVLADVDVPGWYLRELERDRILVPNPDDLELILINYQLTHADVARLRRVTDLHEATAQLFYQRLEAVFADLTNPSTDPRAAMTRCAFLKSPAPALTDPAVCNDYPTILRCLRTQVEPELAVKVATKVYADGDYLAVESGERTFTMYDLYMLEFRLGTHDIASLLYAKDLVAAICDAAGVSRSELPLQLPNSRKLLANR